MIQKKSVGWTIWYIWHCDNSLKLFYFVYIFLSAPSVYTYTQFYGLHCSKDRYGSFGTIQSAKDACSKDINCRAVFDNQCDEGHNSPGDIHLCPISTLYWFEEADCIFQKNRNGKYFKSFCFDVIT